MTTITKWLAANNSPESQPAAPGRTIFLYRFLRVLGAAWRKPAMLTQVRAQKELVSANYSEKNFLHF